MKKASITILAGLITATLSLHAKAEFRADTILSVLRGEDVVFASTRIGLFRSSPSNTNWVPVTLPHGIEPGGCLNTSDAGTSRIYYSPPKKTLTDQYDLCPVGYGLWVSEDLGNTWSLVDSVHLFRSVLFHGDGLLYASVREPSDKSNVEVEIEMFGGHAVVSRDGGKTWEKTEGADEIPGVLTLAGCVTNPAHVCATGWRVRTYCMEYAPEQKKWTFRASFMPNPDATPDEYLALGMGSGTSPCCLMFRANLENYYRGSFGATLQRIGIVAKPSKMQYRFRKNGPMVIDIDMGLLPTDPPLSKLPLPDIDLGQACWGLKYVDPDGKVGYVAPAATNTPTSAKITVHDLRVGNTYRRRLDLQALVHLDKPGTYKAVLVFDNSKLIKRNPEEWTGYLSGEPFEIVISRR
jgi:hypothetical protein